MLTFKEFIIEQQEQEQTKASILDQVQSALDIAGFEPTIGTGADAANTVISTLRAAASKESDTRKKHLINAGISAISLIPFADVIKLLKLRKSAADLASQGASGLQKLGKNQQAGDRFNTGQAVSQFKTDALQEKKEKRRLDPKCWKGYRRAGTKLKDGTRVNKCIKVNR